MKDEFLGLKRMDEFFFVLSLHVFILLLVDIFNAHLFGLEVIIAIGNTLGTMWVYFKSRK